MKRGEHAANSISLGANRKRNPPPLPLRKPQRLGEAGGAGGGGGLVKTGCDLLGGVRVGIDHELEAGLMGEYEKLIRRIQFGGWLAQSGGVDFDGDSALGGGGDRRFVESPKI